MRKKKKRKKKWSPNLCKKKKEVNSKFWLILQVSGRAAGRGGLFSSSGTRRSRQQPGSSVYRPGCWFIASDLDIERDRLGSRFGGERQRGLAGLWFIGYFPSCVPDDVPAEGSAVSRPRPRSFRNGDSRSGRCVELASWQRLLALLLPLQADRSFFKEKDALSQRWYVCGCTNASGTCNFQQLKIPYRSAVIFIVIVVSKNLALYLSRSTISPGR